MTVERTISNIGIVTAATPYGYYLSARPGRGEPERRAHGGGGAHRRRPEYHRYRPHRLLHHRRPRSAFPFLGSGQPNQVSGADLLLVPSGSPAATYTLTIVMDPDQTTGELSRTNDDTAAQGTIQIAADPLQILTSTRLPSAVVNVPYSQQLTGAGGLAPESWTLLGGGLPPGFSFTPQGVISGIAPITAVGNYSVVVQLQSGGQQQVAALLLAVTDASSPIQILTEGDSLPPATVGIAYDQQLAAQGGIPPYTWVGTPPGEGTLTLERNGCSAERRCRASVTVGPQSFTVTVSDQIGNTAEGSLRLQIVSPALLNITTDPSGCTTAGECPANINPLQVGEAAQVVFTAVEGGTAAHQFSWELPAGQALPAGLSAQPLAGSPGGQSFALSGTPGQAGIFPFRLPGQRRSAARRRAPLRLAGEQRAGEVAGWRLGAALARRGSRSGLSQHSIDHGSAGSHQLRALLGRPPARAHARRGWHPLWHLRGERRAPALRVRGVGARWVGQPRALAIRDHRGPREEERLRHRRWPLAALAGAWRSSHWGRSVARAGLRRAC